MGVGPGAEAYLPFGGTLLHSLSLPVSNQPKANNPLLFSLLAELPLPLGIYLKESK